MSSVRRIVSPLTVGIIALVTLLVAIVIQVLHAYSTFGEEQAGFNGIRFGDSRDELRYKLGIPPAVLAWPPPEDKFPGMLVYYTSDQHPRATPKSILPAGTTVDQYPVWDYESPTVKADVQAWFDPKTARVAKIECFDFTEPASNFCQPVLGIRTGDSEDRLVSILGSPASQSIDKAGVKTMAYPDIGLTLLLKTTHVYGIELVGQDTHRPVPWGRFLRWVA